MQSQQYPSQHPNWSSPLPDYLQSDDVHCWSTSPLQTDPRIVKVPWITHAFATHRSVELYRHPPAAAECGLRLVHDELGCVVPPDGEAMEVVMPSGGRVKVYDAFNYVIVSNHGSDVFGISCPTCLEKDITCTLSTWFRGSVDDGTRLIDEDTGMEMAIIGHCVGCTQAGMQASGIVGGSVACREVKSLNLNFISSEWLGTRKPVLTSKQSMDLIRLRVEARAIRYEALEYTRRLRLYKPGMSKSTPVEAAATDKQKQPVQEIKPLRSPSTTDDGSGPTFSSNDLFHSWASTMIRGTKRRVRSDSDSDAGHPDPTPGPKPQPTNMSGLLSQDGVLQHILSLAEISKATVDDVKRALGQIEPHSESGRLFVALVEHLKHVGEQQVDFQMKIDQLTLHRREGSLWQDEHDAKLKRSVEQTRVASNRVHQLESDAQKSKRALQALHDLASIRADRGEALKAQVKVLQGELSEVKGDLREANDTIVMCDRELRAVRAERARDQTVVKAEPGTSRVTRPRASTRKARLR